MVTGRGTYVAPRRYRRSVTPSRRRGHLQRAVVATLILLVLAAAFLPIGSRTESRDGTLFIEYHSVLSLTAGTPLNLPYVLSALLAVVALSLLVAWRRLGVG